MDGALRHELRVPFGYREAKEAKDDLDAEIEFRRGYPQDNIIFEDSIQAVLIEVCNPGVPLNDLQRLLDLPPRSRNEALASFMRRAGVCQERGSGIDKVIHEIERYQLPPPDFRTAGDNTVAVLFMPRKLTSMTPADRVRASYQHVCLMYVSNQRMTNTSLTSRFLVDATTAASMSRYLGEALRADLIRLGNPESRSTKDRWYLPAWA